MTREQQLEAALKDVCQAAKALDPFNLKGGVKVHEDFWIGNDEATQMALDHAIENAEKLLRS